MFKVGDIVECLRDRPYMARINKGELAVIKSVNKSGYIQFKNWPVVGRSWTGCVEDFKLQSIDLENK